ncbi:hypothetical protein LDENG_00172750 [Lucifuga dentata]|nr:hypothetical protein LDENG_00172750 [Lucifuga dentata]
MLFTIRQNTQRRRRGTGSVAFDALESKMENMYIKPGNQERGWNDPPQFSYSLQMARGPQRNLLNRRAAPPPAAAPPAAAPPAPPPAAAPPAAARPPCSAVTPPPTLGPVRCQRDTSSSQSEHEPDVEGVVCVLTWALDVCRQTGSGQVCNDVEKRLRFLEDSWRSGKLSLPVRRRMNTLAKEFQSGNWDSADEIHRSLMVDHVTEVSQWMVGVKRLIAETRKLSPELLKPVQNHAEPVQDPTEPIQNHAAEPVQDPAEPVQDPAELFQSTISQ